MTYDIKTESFIDNTEFNLTLLLSKWLYGFNQKDNKICTI